LPPSPENSPSRGVVPPTPVCSAMPRVDVRGRTRPLGWQSVTFRVPLDPGGAPPPPTWRTWAMGDGTARVAARARDSTAGGAAADSVARQVHRGHPPPIDPVRRLEPGVRGTVERRRVLTSATTHLDLGTPPPRGSLAVLALDSLHSLSHAHLDQVCRESLGPLEVGLRARGAGGHVPSGQVDPPRESLGHLSQLAAACARAT